MRLVLVHHADAVGPEVDPQRPLSMVGRFDVERLAAAAAAKGVKPAVIWHSGKLRSRQTAEAFWKACNPFAEFKATRGLQPSDGPWLFRDVLAEEERDLLAVGHMPSLPRILALLSAGSEDVNLGFPLHGVVALSRDDRDVVEGGVAAPVRSRPLAARVRRRRPPSAAGARNLEPERHADRGAPEVELTEIEEARVDDDAVGVVCPPGCGSSGGRRAGRRAR